MVKTPETMKKLAIFATLLTLVLSGCTENTLDNIAPEVNNEITLPDLTAGFADDDVTKTYVEESKYLRWHEADLITAFYGNTLNRQYKFKGKTGDNSGTFSLVPSGELGTGNALEAIYAIYPYDEGATITDKGEISLSLPATQLYAENSFGRGANTMIAVTESVEDTFLGFKNACGYLKLKLYNESGARLKSVEVRGNNSEKIAGSATATIEFGGVPTVTMLADATTSVTLDCGEEGIELGTTSETATELWVVLPEVTFEGGITITATDTEGITFEKSTTNPVAITRNEIQPMKALEAVFEVNIPETWKIYYTATAKIEKQSWSNTTFGANIVSNKWNETTGEGVITFDGEVTSIGEDAFYNCDSIVSVSIPDSVTSIGVCAFSVCRNLTDFTIPDRVVSIGDNAFYFCTSLANITIPDSVTSIGEFSFYNCSKLTSAIIGESVTSIRKASFGNCWKLASITIPDSVTSIGDHAFSYCKSLESVTIPEGVTSISTYAFSSCSSLAEVYCKPTTPPTAIPSTGLSPSWDAFDSNASGRKIYVPTESVEAYKTAEWWSKYADDIIAYDFEKGEVVVPTPEPNPENCEVVITYLAPSDEMEFYSWLNNLDRFAYDVSNMGGSTGYSSRPSTDYQTFTIWLGYELTTVTFMKDFYTYPFTMYETEATLTLPASVTSIVVESGATRIFNKLYIKATTPPALNDGNHPYGLGYNIYVPTESVNAYKTADGWSDYADSIVGYDFE